MLRANGLCKIAATVWFWNEKRLRPIAAIPMSRTSPPNCASPGLSLGSLIARDPAGGVAALFAGRRVSYSFNTRVAIRRACDLLGLKPGDEVLVPAYHCGSELDPLLAAGLSVRLYPVDRATRIDPAQIARLITPQTRAIYLTHYFGVLHPNTAAIRQLCDDYGLWLIEDCALSLLSGQSPAEGHTGDIALFCFYKLFPVLGGGALVLNTDKITGTVAFANPAPRKLVAKALIRAVLDAVLGRAGIAALRKLRPRKDTAPAARTAYPDMPADYYFDPALKDAGISRVTARAMGSFNVAGTISVRRANYQQYQVALAGLPGITQLYPDLPDDACPLNMPVLVENRDALCAALTAQGIGATPWWAGFHQGIDVSGFPDAAYLKNHLLALPLHQTMGTAHVAHVVDRLTAAMRPS
jgi:perosamine synthetase